MEIPRHQFNAWDAASDIVRIRRVYVLGGELISLDVFAITAWVYSAASSGGYDWARISRGYQNALESVFGL